MTGTFFGVLLNGYLVAKFGSKRVLIVALFCTSAFQFIPFFAPTKAVLVVGQVLNGCVPLDQLLRVYANLNKFSLGSLRNLRPSICQ